LRKQIKSHNTIRRSVIFESCTSSINLDTLN
jgi:hypothetical protein